MGEELWHIPFCLSWARDCILGEGKKCLDLVSRMGLLGLVSIEFYKK